jgi:hypothetical protein
MTTYKTTRPSMAGLKEDILGAGMHLLSGAGGDLKLMVQQAVKSVIGDAYVSRKDYDALLKRVAALEAHSGKKPAKTAAKPLTKKPKSPAKSTRK